MKSGNLEACGKCGSSEEYTWKMDTPDLCRCTSHEVWLDGGMNVEPASQTAVEPTSQAVDEVCMEGRSDKEPASQDEYDVEPTNQAVNEVCMDGYNVEPTSQTVDEEYMDGRSDKEPAIQDEYDVEPTNQAFDEVCMDGYNVELTSQAVDEVYMDGRSDKEPASQMSMTWSLPIRLLMKYVWRVGRIKISSSPDVLMII